MSAKTMMAAEKQETTLEQLNVRVEELRKLIDERNASLAKNRQLQSERAMERETQVVPARALGNAGAQKRLRDIDAELVRIRCDISDDTAAIVELSTQLMSAEQDVERADWEAGRAKVRGLLVARMKSDAGSKLQKAAKDLAAAMDTAEKEDNELRTALIPFGRNFNFSALRSLRVACVSFELMRQLQLDRNGFYGRAPHGRDSAADDQQYYGEALEALDQLELVF